MTNVRFQTLILIIFILISLALTNGYRNKNSAITEEAQSPAQGLAAVQPNLSFQAAALKTVPPPAKVEVKKTPVRNWEVLDPKVNAAAVLVESLDDGFPFFYYQTYKSWPLASLTKLLTAVVVLEDIGANKKIEITEAVVATEGNGGGFHAGEVYTALDVLKIMIITSSNDAAAAFENYYGQETLVSRLNEKAKELKMLQTKIYDAAGLADENVSSATDISRLMKYIAEKHPEILNWSRLPSILVQPINKVESHDLRNVNPLVENKNFWGGKTGTSPAAKENLAALFSFNNQRLIIVILGSQNRFNEIDDLLNWVAKAYKF